MKQGLTNGISWFGEAVLGGLQYNITALFVGLGCLTPVLIAISFTLFMVKWYWLDPAPPSTAAPIFSTSMSPPAPTPDADAVPNATDRMTNAQYADANGLSAFAIEGDRDKEDCQAKGWRIMRVNLPNGETVQECQFIVYK